MTVSRSTKTRSVHRFRLALATFALTIATLTAGTGAQPAQSPTGGEGYANFDIRVDKQSASAAQLTYLERLSPSPAAFAAAVDVARVREDGVARLKGADRAIAIERHPALGSLEIVSAMPGGRFLSGPSDDRVGTLRGFLSAYGDAYGVTAAQVQALEVVADYVNPAGNMAWAELQQTFNDVPVFQGIVRGAFTAKGELVRTTGVLAVGIDAASLAASPSLSARQAIALAASNVGWKVDESALADKGEDGAGHATFAAPGLAGDATAWPVYFAMRSGIARLAWATQVVGDPMAYLILVDAADGTVLFRKNLTNFQTQSATYNVYNDDSPAPLSPTTVLPGAGTQAPPILRSTFTLIGNEAPNTFNNNGWITDGQNITDGNNVEAGIDIDGTNGVDAPVAGTSRVFNFSYNPAPGSDAPNGAAYRNGEVTDMFYWTNVYHDRVYSLGFTEPARNFQHDNFGRGGAAADRISAEAQDSSGTNNANFSTPADGSRGRMQMFIFPGPTPDRTSALDHDVLLHELTHGLSNRLHSNASGLTTDEAKGLGEGWSDFYARALLSAESENVNGIYSTGGWVTHLLSAGYTDNYYYGIRRFPYAVKTNVGPNGRPHNPLTFKDIDPTQIDLSDGAFAAGPFGTPFPADEVHNSGEVWSMALLEVRARFITRLGFALGNQRILQFVTDGMKLDPVNPTFLQARDSIIAAANGGAGTAADIADIWAGFATRGMGVLATQSGFSVVESYLTPSDPLPTFSINDLTVVEGDSGTTAASFTVSLANAPSAQHRVRFTTVDGTATAPVTPFTNGAAIVIPGTGTSGPAAPYPSTINVAGVLGTVANLAVRLDDMNHTFPDDIDILLVGPAGQKVLLMSDAGGTGDLVNVDLTFQDDAAPLADGSLLASGTFAPSNFGAGDTFPAPAPVSPYATTLSVFNGTNPNGTWSLYVVDDVGGDIGNINGGFTLFITASNGDYVPASGELVFPPGTTSLPLTVTVNGDLVNEPNESFLVNLSNPISAVIGDGQGIGTILADEGPQPPTGLYASSIVGNVLTLRFTPPIAGPAPIGYALEGGLNPGETLASVPTGSTAPIFALTAPNGAFFVRMRTVTAAGTSGPSNEIRVFINTPTPPSAPTNLLATVNGSSLDLAWKNTFTGGAPTSLILDATGTLSGSVPIPLGESFSFAGVPAGTYTISLRAANAAGAGGSSNAVAVTIPSACSGAPLTPGNFLTFKSGSTLSLFWDPAATGPAPTGFVVNVTGAFVGSFPFPGRGVSASVGPGTYNFTVQGVNACGASAPTAVQSQTVP